MWIGVFGVATGVTLACAAFVGWHAWRVATPPTAQQEFDVSKGKPQFTTRSFGGELLGYDVGEWGGKLAFRDANGHVTDVIPDNVHAIIPHGEDMLVFTGLAHMGENHGAIYLLRQDPKRIFSVTQLHRLDGQPDRIEADVDGGWIDFSVFTGQDDRRGGSWIYQCRRLTRDLQLEVLTSCKVGEPK